MGFKEKMSRTLNQTAQKSTELAQKAKMKVDITTKKSAITAREKEIGHLVYEARVSAEDVTTQVEALCMEIDGLYAEIDELEAQ
jgi:hypothetical protein